MWWIVGTVFSEEGLTIYLFETVTKMKTSNVCVLVISALVVQVSSEEVTELDKMAVNLVHSLFDIVEIPYRKIENIINPSEAGLEKLPFLEDLAIKLKRKKEEIEKTYMESLTPEIRELEKNRLREYANTSQKIIKSIQDFKKMARSMINAYFNNLPKNVQNKLIGLGQDLNNILHKLKELSKNGSSEVKHK